MVSHHILPSAVNNGDEISASLCSQQNSQFCGTLHNE